MTLHACHTMSASSPSSWHTATLGRGSLLAGKVASVRDIHEAQRLKNHCFQASRWCLMFPATNCDGSNRKVLIADCWISSEVVSISCWKANVWMQEIAHFSKCSMSSCCMCFGWCTTGEGVDEYSPHGTKSWWPSCCPVTTSWSGRVKMGSISVHGSWMRGWWLPCLWFCWLSREH